MSTKVPFSTTIEVRDTCLCLATQRAARALARRFDEALRPFGLTNQQFSLLMALNRPEPPTMGPVCRLLGMDRTTLTAALKRLEREGLLEVQANPDDRRSRLLVLTEAGHALLLQALPVWRREHADLEGARPDLAFDDLRGSLAALAHAEFVKAN